MRSLIVLAVPLILTMACTERTPTTPSDVSNTQALAQQLELRGATVTIAEAMPRESNSFFSVTARRLIVDGESVTVFEYPDAASLDADAGKVHPSGTPIGGTQVTWIAPPRFYRSTRLIVIYAGTEREVAARFEAVLGPPFAGVR